MLTAGPPRATPAPVLSLTARAAADAISAAIVMRTAYVPADTA